MSLHCTKLRGENPGALGAGGGSFAFLGKMNNPTPEQEEMIKRRGRFVVLACPGSGKTFAVAHRLARRLREWEHPRAGIAALSFTNVAYEEIGYQLKALGLPAQPAYPHFLGTIDSFINSWIFLPFGHLVMGCNRRPSIVGTAYDPWQPTGGRWAWGKAECNRSGCRLTDFTFDINGNLINLTGQRRNCPERGKPCVELKQRFVRLGYATQADANYWAMRILEAYSRVAAALSRRFREMIIDEAQDTSDIQMRIVDLLGDKGLEEIMLVGDPDQAIYEWRDANPEIFESKTDTDGWGEPHCLEDNWRSSRYICEATVGFSKCLSESSRAIGEDANFEARPAIVEYDSEDYPSLRNEFLTVCQRYGILAEPDKVAILVRTRRILRKVLGIQQEGQVSPWNHEITRLLAGAASHYELGDVQQARRCIRSAALSLCFGSRNYTAQEIEKHVASTMGTREWQIGLWRLIKGLPPPNLALSDWIAKTRENCRVWFSESDWPVADQADFDLRVKRSVGGDRAFLNRPVSSFFTDPSYQQEGVTVETVHAAKGKTYDAVLFVVSDKASRSGTAKQLGERQDGDEEIRIAYVAITRPRKLLIVAIPKGTESRHLYRFPDWMKTELPVVQFSLF